jgi:hypothetical protein
MSGFPLKLLNLKDDANALNDFQIQKAGECLNNSCMQLDFVKKWI